MRRYMMLVEDFKRNVECESKNVTGWTVDGSTLTVHFTDGMTQVRSLAHDRTITFEIRDNV